MFCSWGIGEASSDSKFGFFSRLPSLCRYRAAICLRYVAVAVAVVGAAGARRAQAVTIILWCWQQVRLECGEFEGRLWTRVLCRCRRHCDCNGEVGRLGNSGGVRYAMEEGSLGTV